MNSKGILVSVIVPVYNTEKYIKKCVDSILNQTYENLEIILVDDGSTDASSYLCDEYQRKDLRVKTYHKKNGGSSSARNLGIKNATGDFYAFVDSDDFISETMYEKLVRSSGDGTKIVQIGRDEIDENGRLLPDICETPSRITEYSADEFIKELLLHKGDCSFCTKIIPAHCFKGRKFPEGLLNEDFNLLFKILTDDVKVVSLPEKGYHVFYRLGSNSRKEDKKTFSRVYADCVDNADMVLKYVNTYKPELKEVALRFSVFQRIEYLLHIPIAEMRGDNKFYTKVVNWLRANYFKTITNHILTSKNKLYMTLFAIAPKTVRVVHAKVKGIK